MIDTASREPTDIFFRSRDGLRLHARFYPAPGSPRRTALCLPGLTRNHRDFNDLARFLSRPGPEQRAVLCIDYRGRGLSEWDSDWKNYAVPLEMFDVIDLLVHQDLHDVAVIGTSRGGLIAMVMGAAQPSAIGAVVLNDIGPVIETDGLTRIATYVGRIPLPRTWDEATRIVKNGNASQFPGVPDAMWPEIARQLYNEKNGRPDHGYDPELKNALSVLDGPMPELWPQFASLTRVPMMVLRGAHSDLLTNETVAEMGRRHPNFIAATVPGEGHAPLLKDDASMSAISSFLARADKHTE